MRRRAALIDDLIADYRTAAERRGKSIMRTDIGFRRLLDRFGGRSPESITPDEVESWQSELLEDLSVATVNHHLQVLRAVLLHAVKNRRLRREDMPSIKLRNPNNKRTRYLTEEEEPKLVAELPEWLRPLVALAIHTGMRKGELLKLKWQDVDFPRGTIGIREAKSGEGRGLPMNSVARSVLSRLWEVRRERLRARVVNHNEGAAYVISAPEGGMLHNLNRYWYAALKRANIADLHFHGLRHTFASRYMMAGGDLFSLQILLGHKTAVMVQRYAHLDQKHLRTEIERLAGSGPKPWSLVEARPVAEP
jgi:integrase